LLGIEVEDENEDKEEEEREEKEGPGEVMEDYIVSRKDERIGKREMNRAEDPKRIEIAGEDLRKPRAVMDPTLPSLREIEEHNLTHSQYRNWCSVCVRAWGQEDAHKTDRDKDERGIPIIDIDYGYMSYNEKGEEQGGKLETSGIGRPIIVMKCRKLKYYFADQVPAKGGESQAVRIINDNITQVLGYNRVIVKSDQEPAIKDLIEKVKE
jgi:hypothetical protein